MSDGFSCLAENYEQQAIVQRSLGKQLLGLVDIYPTDDVLDVGCATGYFSRQIASRTKGMVFACDSSQKMIEQAQKHPSKGGNLHFLHCPIESFELSNCVDFVFSNNVLEWVSHPELAMLRCRQALRPRGLMAIQTLMSRCENFTKAMYKLRNHPLTADFFQNFISPWFHFDRLDNYKAWILEVGFSVSEAKIERVELPVNLSEAISIFDTFELPAYFNPACYSECPSEAYFKEVKELVRAALAEQCDSDGIIHLIFNSAFLLLNKR